LRNIQWADIRSALTHFETSHNCTCVEELSYSQAAGSCGFFAFSPLIRPSQSSEKTTRRAGYIEMLVTSGHLLHSHTVIGRASFSATI